MKKRHIASIVISIIILIALIVTGAMCHYIFRRNPGPSAGLIGEIRSVRLANRTVEVRFGDGRFRSVTLKKPDLPANPSRRGTASFLVVSRKKATQETRWQIERYGARIIGVVAPYGIIVEADASALENLFYDRSFRAQALSAADKISMPLMREIASNAGDVSITVVPLQKEDSKLIEEYLREKGAKIRYEVASDMGSVRADVRAELISEIAERGDVRWVERFVSPKLLTDVAVRPGLLNVTPIHSRYGLTGKGQYITISDSGLDTGNAYTMTADFKNRLGFMITVQGCLGYDQVGHGTHVAGIAAGNGALSGGWFKGVAYESKINFFHCGDSQNNIWTPYPSGLLSVIDEHPSYIHSGSWGGGNGSEYSSWSVEFDDYLWRHPEILAVFAAGNSKTAYTILEPAGAKNVLAVGATENRRPYESSSADNPSEVASFSSKGPMGDGRIKPDVCAPGTYVSSVRSSKASGTAKGLYPGFSRYMYDSGTSMATPFVSGCAVLIRQWLTERRGIPKPTASLIKAILTGGAYDMSADSGSLCGGSAPNNSQGWGRVDLGQSLYPTNASVMVVDRIAFSEGSTHSVKLTVTNSAPLSVQLVWTDYPGSEYAEKALVNDLDLVVSNGLTGAVWYGNRVSGGDRVNTVESVRLPACDVSQGEYYVLVKGVSVLYDSTEGGAAALYVRGAFSEKAFDSWNSDPRANFNVRSYMILSSNKGYRWKYSEQNVQKGKTVDFAVPVSIPGKSETIDVSSSGDFYSDENGKSKKMNIQRLGRIEIAEPGADCGEPVTNETGYMATSFSLKVDSDKDILFRFYDEASTNVATALPMWWYKRYVEEDPLADILRFTSVSPRYVEWMGCVDKPQILERSETLGETAQWLPVYQRLPAPVLTNSWSIPARYSTNSFFRIRYAE